MDQFVQEARPPYVRFEVRAIQKMKPASEGGEIFFIDEVFALVTPSGSKDVVEKICSEWFPVLREEVRQGRFSAKWLEAYEGGYRAFKNDQEPPLNGISIKNWPSASPAEIKILTQLRCLTVEDLAAANEELVARIGMGARSLVARAKDYLTAKSDHAPLVAQVEALRQVVAGLEVRLATMTTRSEQLEMALRGKETTISTAIRDGLPPVEDRLAAARASNSGPSDESLIADAIADA